MDLGSLDRLLLHEQAGADFDFAADAEGIDALVADGLLGVGANNLPMIVFRAVTGGLRRLPISGKTDQIEAAVTSQVGDIEHGCRRRNAIQEDKPTVFVGKPNQRVQRVVRGVLRDWTEKQVKCAIVVEIGDKQTY